MHEIFSKDLFDRKIREIARGYVRKFLEFFPPNIVEICNL